MGGTGNRRRIALSVRSTTCTETVVFYVRYDYVPGNHGPCRKTSRLGKRTGPYFQVSLPQPAFLVTKTLLYPDRDCFNTLACQIVLCVASDDERTEPEHGELKNYLYNYTDTAPVYTGEAFRQSARAAFFLVSRLCWRLFFLTYPTCRRTA